MVGGASGIGAAVVARQRRAGAEVLVWDLGEGADLVCDIGDPRQVEVAADATVDRLGPPDTVTVTAGVAHGGALLDASAWEWDRVMGVNARGVWLALRALARPMLQGGGGSMVAVSSVSARLADRSMGLYCASKAALDMIIRVAASEWAPSVRVNGVAPGVTDTPLLGPVSRQGAWLRGVASRTAMGRLGTADEVAEAVVGLHAMPWVTGAVLTCDGGLSLHSPIDPPTGSV